MIHKLFVTAGVLLICSSASAYSVFGCLDSDPNAEHCAIYVSGDINQQKVAEVTANLNKVRKMDNRIVFIILNSEGGDVSSAMEIGRLLRNDPNHAAIVEVGHKCLSACVFILAGAQQRDVRGRGVVGIHRPYYPEVEKLPPQERQQRYRQFIQISKNYLNQMNIREDLVDAMTIVPAEEMKILTDAELSRYGLNKNDPVFDEMMDDGIAQRLGLKKIEYLKRKLACQHVSNEMYDACLTSKQK